MGTQAGQSNDYWVQRFAEAQEADRVALAIADAAGADMPWVIIGHEAWLKTSATEQRIYSKASPGTWANWLPASTVAASLREGKHHGISFAAASLIVRGAVTWPIPSRSKVVPEVFAPALFGLSFCEAVVEFVLAERLEAGWWLPRVAALAPPFLTLEDFRARCEVIRRANPFAHLDVLARP